MKDTIPFDEWRGEFRKEYNRPLRRIRRGWYAFWRYLRYDIHQGFYGLWYWLPYAWKWRTWDFNWTLDGIELNLVALEKCLREHGHAEDSIKCADQIKSTLANLHEWRTDSPAASFVKGKLSYAEYSRLEKKHWNAIFDTMKKNGRAWWD